MSKKKMIFVLGVLVIGVGIYFGYGSKKPIRNISYPKVATDTVMDKPTGKEKDKNKYSLNDRLNESFKNNEVVFLAKVIDKTEITKSLKQDELNHLFLAQKNKLLNTDVVLGSYVKVSISKVIHGDLDSELILKQLNPFYKFDIGKEYIVFSRKETDDSYSVYENSLTKEYTSETNDFLQKVISYYNGEGK